MERYIVGTISFSYTIDEEHLPPGGLTEEELIGAAKKDIAATLRKDSAFMLRHLDLQVESSARSSDGTS